MSLLAYFRVFKEEKAVSRKGAKAQSKAAKKNRKP
jgi:hypothetical protein